MEDIESAAGKKIKSNLKPVPAGVLQVPANNRSTVW